MIQIFRRTTKTADNATVQMEQTNHTDPETLNINIWPTVGRDTYHILGNALILTNGTCLIDAKIWLNRARVDDALSPEVARALRDKCYRHVENKTSRTIELFHTDF